MDGISVDAIGTAAGRVWHYLHRHGRSRLAAVRRDVDMPEPVVYMAIGWLAREGKLDVERESRFFYVSLKG